MGHFHKLRKGVRKGVRKRGHFHKLIFSTKWKKFWRVFHARNGKKSSTVWKSFPRCGKVSGRLILRVGMALRAVLFQFVRSVFPLAGARGWWGAPRLACRRNRHATCGARARRGSRSRCAVRLYSSAAGAGVRVFPRLGFPPGAPFSEAPPFHCGSSPGGKTHPRSVACAPSLGATARKRGQSYELMFRD